MKKAKTDPAAQEKINRILQHPEFELYNIKKDPWELNNLAAIPEHAEKLNEMHTQLKAEMDRLKDKFSSVDPKLEKKKERGENNNKKNGSKKKNRKQKEQ